MFIDPFEELLPDCQFVRLEEVFSPPLDCSVESASNFVGAVDVVRRFAPCIIVISDSESEEKDPEEDIPQYYFVPMHSITEFPGPIQALSSPVTLPHQSSLEIEVIVLRRGLEAIATHLHKEWLLEKPSQVPSSSLKRSSQKEEVASLRRGLEALVIHLEQEDLLSPII